VQLEGDTLRRRILVSRLVDRFGNPMDAYEREFRVWDENAPHVDALPNPPTAPDGVLSAGAAYELTPVLSGIDDVSPENPGGDVDRVDYYLHDPEEPGNPTQPAFSSSTHPFSYGFVGAYGGDGTNPWPFSVGARAVDTSTNGSNVARLDMQVLPNSAPTMTAVLAVATSPVHGVFYAGSTIRASVLGLGDSDGAQLTLSLELRESGATTPLVTVPGRSVARPASGTWADLEPQIFDIVLPITQAEGATLHLRATAIDSQNASFTLDSDPFAVADDENPPLVEALVAREADSGTSGTLFYIGDAFFVELRVRDIETAVDSVEVVFDQVFDGPLAADRVAGSDSLYRTSVLTVPHDVFTEETPVAVTVSAYDLGANSAVATLELRVAPEPDPTAPTVEWITPWEGATWPAGHESVLGGEGTALLLRVRAHDTSDDGAGGQVPGEIVEVQLWGPEVDGEGEIVLTAVHRTATLVDGTSASGSGDYELLWLVPNLVPAGTPLPFRVRVVDTGGLDVVREISVQTLTPRKVYEGVTGAALADDPMLAAGGDPAGPVFLLDGTTLSLYPQADETVRSLDSLYLYAGGDVGSVSRHPSP